MAVLDEHVSQIKFHLFLCRCPLAHLKMSYWHTQIASQDAVSNCMSHSRLPLLEKVPLSIRSEVLPWHFWRCMLAFRVPVKYVMIISWSSHTFVKGGSWLQVSHRTEHLFCCTTEIIGTFDMFRTSVRFINYKIVFNHPSGKPVSEN